MPRGIDRTPAVSTLRPRQLVAGALALAGYALASHLLMAHAARDVWAAALLLAPATGIVVAAAWRWRRGVALAGATLIAAAFAAWAARGGLDAVERLYLLQHVAIHAALGLVFGLTLRRGATPLISLLAERLQGPLGPAKQRYTRRLTVVWVGYFGAMVVVSLALYRWAPWWWWSLYANVLTPLAAATLFVGEHLLRRRLHPEFGRLGLAHTWQAYRATPSLRAPSAE